MTLDGTAVILNFEKVNISGLDKYKISTKSAVQIHHDHMIEFTLIIL